MANRVQPIPVGVDVSKSELVLSVNGDEPVTLPNTLPALRAWLRGWSGPLAFALEATNDFHLLLALEAHGRGHGVYVLNGYRLNRYRESIGGRAKTDASDARLLARYLQREQDGLRPWTPPPPGYRSLQSLLHRRATLVQARTRLQQSLAGLPGLKSSLRAVLRRLDHLDRLIQQRIHKALQQAHWDEAARRCQGIEGIGPLTAAALVMAYQRGPFRNSDAFVAFLGLDVRVRDSGQRRGRRCLTKRGDPEVRRLLYMAAMQAQRQPAWQGYYQRYLNRGLSRIQALNILARKLARVAFAILKNQTEYVPGKACVMT